MVQNNLDGTSALAKSNIAVTQIKMSWVFIFYIYLFSLITNKHSYVNELQYFDGHVLFTNPL